MQYENPIWREYFADPFVLRTGGMYWAYGTGGRPLEPDGRAFPLLRSPNLVDWQPMGGALEPVQGATAYWAPEVAEEAGRFYLYYSMATEAGDEHHRLRVATADSPGGPFVDSGKLLMPDQGFSIDPNPFRDPKTGQWYLFFATDYIEDEPHGTGVAVVKMKDMLTAEGPAKMVTRATQDWQIYERGRMHLGRTWEAWYTVEGPCAILHDGRY
ncbi:MAG TPA: family 43 glycosylhydrolase, partial [Tepidisphaeraceae bacterium]